MFWSTFWRYRPRSGSARLNLIDSRKVRPTCWFKHFAVRSVGCCVSHVLCQDSSSEDDEDEFGPSVVGKEKRVASERCVIGYNVASLPAAHMNIANRLDVASTAAHGCLAAELTSSPALSRVQRAMSRLTTNRNSRSSDLLAITRPNQSGSKSSQAPKTAGAEARG